MILKLRKPSAAVILTVVMQSWHKEHFVVFIPDLSVYREEVLHSE